MTTSLPSRAVKAVITNESDKILFLQRNPAIRDTNNWDLPGGLIENESAQSALKRELDEELGVEVEVGNKIGEWSFFRPLDGKTVRVANYSCCIVSGKITLSEEHVAMEWVTKTEAKKLNVKDASLFNALDG